MADKPVNRRAFFRASLRELIKPLSGTVENLQSALHQLEKLDSPRPAPTPPQPKPVAWLRPPGALPEKQLAETCSRCMKCVNVCPAQCIKIDSTGAKGGGLPYIDPTEMPCVVCDGLVCMRDCPTEALVPTALALIDMGTAVWHEDKCIRSKGQECTICVDQCPIGEMALRVEAGKIRVIDDNCIGCGDCQHYCPTTPKSITVTPKAAR